MGLIQINYFEFSTSFNPGWILFLARIVISPERLIALLCLDLT